MTRADSQAPRVGPSSFVARFAQQLLEGLVEVDELGPEGTPLCDELGGETRLGCLAFTRPERGGTAKTSTTLHHRPGDLQTDHDDRDRDAPSGLQIDSFRVRGRQYREDRARPEQTRPRKPRMLQESERMQQTEAPRLGRKRDPSLMATFSTPCSRCSQRGYAGYDDG